MDVVVIINYARSGGTLLNRCLATHPDLMVFSEVNPLAEDRPKHNLTNQAKEWYDINLKSESFKEKILELVELCEDRGKTLVLRDWSFFDFKRKDRPIEEKSFSILENLPKNINVKTFAFVRDAIDVGIARNYYGKVNISDFSKAYLSFTKAVYDNGIKIFKYEDFVINYEKEFSAMMEYCKLKYFNVFNDFHKVQNVMGDTKLKINSRGKQFDEIKPLKRRWVAKKLIKVIESDQALLDANKYLGYSGSYYDGEVETIIDMIKRSNYWTKLRAMIKNIF